MENAEHYFNGDACKWTGNAVERYSGFFYEYLLIEGHRKGELIYSEKKPNLKKAA